VGKETAVTMRKDKAPAPLLISLSKVSHLDKFPAQLPTCKKLSTLLFIFYREISQPRSKKLGYFFLYFPILLFIQILMLVLNISIGFLMIK